MTTGRRKAARTRGPAPEQFDVQFADAVALGLAVADPNRGSVLVAIQKSGNGMGELHTNSIWSPSPDFESWPRTGCADSRLEETSLPEASHGQTILGITVHAFLLRRVSSITTHDAYGVAPTDWAYWRS